MPRGAGYVYALSSRASLYTQHTDIDVGTRKHPLAHFQEIRHLSPGLPLQTRKGPALHLAWRRRTSLFMGLRLDVSGLL